MTWEHFDGSPCGDPRVRSASGIPLAYHARGQGYTREVLIPVCEEGRLVREKT